MEGIPLKATPFLVLSNLFLILIIFFVMRSALYRPYKTNTRTYHFGVFLCLVFCLFSFWGNDWFYFIRYYRLMSDNLPCSAENVYYFFTSLSPHYLVLRFFIWGSALWLFCDIINRLSVSKYLVLTFFGCLFIIWFSYARASLAMVLAYYGFSLFLKPYKNVRFSHILGFLAIGSAFFFHKSGLFAIAMVTSVLLARKYPKRAITILIITFPIVITLLQTELLSFMTSNIDKEESDLASYMERGQSYLNQADYERGFGGFISRFLEKTVYYLYAFMSFKILISKDVYKVPQDIRSFMLLTVMIVAMSSVFLFMTQMNTVVVYDRFIKFSVMPICIVMAYLYQYKIYPRLSKFAIIITICMTVYSILYSAYCAGVKM